MKYFDWRNKYTIGFSGERGKSLVCRYCSGFRNESLHQPRPNMFEHFHNVGECLNLQPFESRFKGETEQSKEYTSYLKKAAFFILVLVLLVALKRLYIYLIFGLFG